jgi:small subunit ribosomal protein S20
VAHSLSAKKRIRQNAKRRALNRRRKAQVKGVIKELDQALHGGDRAKAAEQLKAVYKKLDQIAAKGVIHRNTAARKKSRLARRVGALAAQA